MRVALGIPFAATLPIPPAPSVGVGARVITPVVAAIVTARVPATRVGATWVATLDPPLEAGDYLLEWTDALGLYSEPVPLTVGAATLGGGADPSAWTPDPQTDVAPLCSVHTRRRLEGSGPAYGSETLQFGPETTPTLLEVEGYIDAAVREVAGRVGVPIPVSLVELARQTANWHAAAQVEARRTPAKTDDADGAYRWKQTSYVACLNELTAQARRGPNRLY